MSYDDWKTTDPSAGEHCENGHYHCQSRCPVCKGCVDSCDHGRDDIEPPPSDQDVRAALVEIADLFMCRFDFIHRDIREANVPALADAILADPLLGRLLRGGR